MKNHAVSWLTLCAALAGGNLGAQQAPVFPDLPAEMPVGEGVTVSCLDQVEGTVRCGRFRVYEDREGRMGRTLDLAFVVLEAADADAADDAFTLFNGGPGAAPTAGAAFFAQALAPIRATRDILLIDHRGTGNSGSLACDVPYPSGIESRFASVFPLDQIEDCVTALSARADLTQYHSAHTMDDLADLTRWLGYTALNLDGGSYGTREAQVFVRRHPDLVRTVVLNGVAPVEHPLYIQHARYLHDALERLIDECEADAVCSAEYPQIRADTDSLMETVSTSPPFVVAEGITVEFSSGALSYALRGLLYGQAGVVPQRLTEARNGSWQTLADYYLSRQAWVGDGSIGSGFHFSVLCSEDIDLVTWDDIRRATAATFMGDHLIGGYKRVCEMWPHRRMPAAHFTPVTSTAPTLILSGARDPVTPPAGGEEIAHRWPNSLHVVVPNGGHGQGGPCIQRMIVRLIESGGIGDIDTSCVDAAPPTRFSVPSG